MFEYCYSGNPGMCKIVFKMYFNTFFQVRSLSANLKFPYKRTVSAPGGMGLSAKASNASVPPSLGNLVVNQHGPAFTSSR